MAQDDHTINNTVKFLEIIPMKKGVPEGVGIMAPASIFAKAANGEELSEDEIRMCCKIDWNRNE